MAPPNNPPPSALLQHQHRGGERDDGGGASTPVTVTLSIDDLRIAAIIGVFRFTNGVARGLVPNFDRSCDAEVEGACGEMAFAKFMNTSFMMPNFLPDFPNFEVRTTSRPDGRLIVRKDESSAKRYALVIRESWTRYKVIGWIWGSDAKDPKYFDPKLGLYLVPQSALKSF